MTQTILVFPRQSELRVVRRRLTQHDLDMYAAISGRKPVVEAPEEQQDAETADAAQGADSPAGTENHNFHSPHMIRKPGVGSATASLSRCGSLPLE